jgi:uroporphyrinogen-III synthase
MAFPREKYTQLAIKTRAWATGPGTVQALREAGWPAAQVDAPVVGQFDSEALWALVRHQVPPGGRVLVVRAAGGGRDWLTQQLEADGAVVEHCAAYQRHLPLWTAAQQAEARSLLGPHAVWLLSSSEGIGNLASLLPGQDWSRARAIATHPRIADTARALGFSVVAPSRPTLPDVLASIESLA